jgi:hypothetical protein
MADGCAHLQSLVDIKTPRRKNRHASTHARAEQHPVVASAEEGERWLFCFVDDAFAEY